MAIKEVKVIVEGGKATPAPPIGPAISALGANVGKIVGAINEATKAFAGTKVPVIVKVNMETKDFEIEVGSPPTSELLKKEAGIKKGGGAKEWVGDISLEKVVEVAKKKTNKNIKAKTKEVLGTALSLRLTCNGKDPKEIIKEIDNGQHESLFSS